MDLAGCETMLKTEVGIYKRKQESKKKRKKNIYMYISSNAKGQMELRV